MDTTAPSSRLISLDVLRGLTVMGMIFVNSMSGVAGGLHAQVFPILEHERWQGLHLADLVFPGFLMMMGVSIPMSLGRAKAEHGLTTQEFWRIFWRAVRLVAAGFILSNIWWFHDFSTPWRLFGVLQRFGLVYLPCAVLFMTTGPRTRLAIAGFLLIAYWPLCLLPTADGGPADIWVRGHNFVGSIDRVLLGAGHHNYVDGPDGYDPEGLLGTLPAIAHGLIGIAIGEYILKHRGRNIAAPLAIAGAVMFAAGAAWGFVFPVVKDIWSSTFVLTTCGFTTLVLAGLHALLDNRPAGAPNWLVNIPLAFGINAIAAYVLHELASDMLGWQLLSLPYDWAKTYVGEPTAACIPVVLFIFLIWFPIDYLRRRGWIIKI